MSMNAKKCLVGKKTKKMHDNNNNKTKQNNFALKDLVVIMSTSLKASTLGSEAAEMINRA